MNKQQGFTLIEVLIAAVILFSALAIVADLYKASSFTANRITNKANFYQATTNVISTIKADIHQQVQERKLPEFTGQFSSGGIDYEWQAVRTSFKSRIRGADESFDPSPQFGLYEVKVSAKRGQSTSEPLTFKVATW
ncbi:prepilin-type N-terminal cleavage/methylation domain-containing protein [Thalassotalea atypica]|uniref:prepilin-type N-terminal cleavage/methylation domain-containing protein n=1 Tax=Thalassotalea atypica TaxID=2054316 RepID=UPI00257227FE|nr:prepilin-type N-terminal cleavage/methylation domain-containing protein [Thalassotalea atypica]